MVEHFISKDKNTVCYLKNRQEELINTLKCA